MRLLTKKHPLERILNPAPAPEFEEPVTVKRSKRAKRVTLRLDPQKRVFNLVVPYGASLRAAYKFARDNREWMQEKLAELLEPVPFTHGALIPVLGQERRIDIRFDETLKRTDIRLENDGLLVSTNRDDPAQRIARYLKKMAREHLTRLSHEKAAQIGKKVYSVQIRDARTRWGSCSQDGRIALSWRLILAPYETMDYVVAHEVAHLEHLDHGKAFWALCRNLSENYLDGRYWIEENGQELMRYG